MTLLQLVQLYDPAYTGPHHERSIDRRAVHDMMDMIVGKHPGIISYSDESIDHYNASQKVPTVTIRALDPSIPYRSYQGLMDAWQRAR